MAGLTAGCVLALNNGSSTLKYGWFEADAAGVISRDEGAAASLAEVVSRGQQRGLMAPFAVAHRIVHGGLALVAHSLINADVLAQLQSARALAPLHVGPALALLNETQRQFPHAIQVACLDTAFHANMPNVARTLPLPQEHSTAGLRRFGFHGLALESIIAQLQPRLPPRIVVAHLGGGASVSAILRGRSIDTTMSLTPGGGLMMATRSGDLDPGVVLYLQREKNLDADALQALLNERSGLSGVSGSSGDLRTLNALAVTDPAAKLAIEMFCYGIQKQIAGMISALGGIDLLVFSGGIGENDARVRAAATQGLRPFGIGLDRKRNRAGVGLIQAKGARCAVRVMHCRESFQMARAAVRLLAADDSAPSPIPA